MLLFSLFFFLKKEDRLCGPYRTHNESRGDSCCYCFGHFHTITNNDLAQILTQSVCKCTRKHLINQLCSDSQSRQRPFHCLLMPPNGAREAKVKVGMAGEVLPKTVVWLSL